MSVVESGRAAGVRKFTLAAILVFLFSMRKEIMLSVEGQEGHGS